jgi:hypothetical protein
MAALHPGSRSGNTLFGYMNVLSRALNVTLARDECQGCDLRLLPGRVQLRA